MLHGQIDIGGFPFNSVGGDRKYNAEHFREYFNDVVSDGIFPSPAGQFLAPSTKLGRTSTG